MTLPTLPDVLFYVLAALTGISAVAVVVTQNIVRAATWLLFTLAGTAGIFFLLGASFVGATQLLIYVGGTLVLVVFGVMLTAQGPFITMRIGAAEWVIAVAAGLMLYSVLAISLLEVEAPPSTVEFTPANQGADGDREPAAKKAERELAPSKYLGAALLGDRRVTPKAYITGIPAKGPTSHRERSRVSYLLPFEIVSIHLLVVLIGAAYLARAKRRRGVAA